MIVEFQLYMPSLRDFSTYNNKWNLNLAKSQNLKFNENFFPVGIMHMLSARTMCDYFTNAGFYHLHNVDCRYQQHHSSAPHPYFFYYINVIIIQLHTLLYLITACPAYSLQYEKTWFGMRQADDVHEGKSKQLRTHDKEMNLSAI